MEMTTQRFTAESRRDASVDAVVFTELPSMRTRWTIKPVGSNGWSVLNL